MNVQNNITPIEFKPAVRSRVSLIIGVAGASGSGKTKTGLRIARGLAGGDDSKIAVIATEAGRALHYAPAPGEPVGPDRFGFQHHELRPPFTPEAYADAITAADRQGFEVVMVDSVSHEWEGEGGLQDIHDALVLVAVEKARAAHSGQWSFDEGKVAERASIGAWREPKSRNKRFVSRLLQCRAHLILCLRAEEKIRIEQVEEQGQNGRTYKKTIITQPKDLPPESRWVPICEKRFLFELTLSMLLTPERPGFPIPIKLQGQHRHAVPLDQQISEETGRLLGDWSRGGSTPQQMTAGNGAASGMSQNDDGVLAAGRIAARNGTEALKRWFASITKADRQRLKTILETELKKSAGEADKEDVSFDDSPAVTDPLETQADTRAPEADGLLENADASGAAVPTDEASYKIYVSGKIAQASDPIAIDAWFASEDERALRIACKVGGAAADALQARVKARASELRRAS